MKKIVFAAVLALTALSAAPAGEAHGSATWARATACGSAPIMNPLMQALSMESTYIRNMNTRILIIKRSII
jgi:hypothetical protein